MLLFIQNRNMHLMRPVQFQYISCCYLSVFTVSVLNGEKLFQYISCCYLSATQEYRKIMASLFQYISCCYLSASRICICCQGRCFNTSHVVIYPNGFTQVTRSQWFQYISCCYLSYHGRKSQYRRDKFQYISCCYLSQIKAVQKESLPLFQYISCCYLSFRHFSISFNLFSFNTSHVVIYPSKDKQDALIQLSFNTSHVVIYHAWKFQSIYKIR